MYGTSTTTQSPLEVVTNGEASLRALENLVILILNGDRPKHREQADPFSLESATSIVNPMSPLGSVTEGDEAGQENTNGSDANNPDNDNPDNQERIGPERYESIMDAFYYSTELYEVYKNMAAYIRKSTLYTFWEGTSIGSDEIDSAMETFTIVNAVILEIPFNVIGNMNHAFWDWLEISLGGCSDASGIYTQVAAYMQNSMYVVVYSSISGIMIAILYFMLRPTDVAKFAMWWKRGRWVVLLNILYTLTSILAVVTVFSLISEAYVNSSANICSTYSGSMGPLNFPVPYIIAFVIFSIAVAVVFVMMV